MAKTEASLNRTYHELNLGVDPAVAAEIGYEVPEQYLQDARDIGTTAAAATKPEIPADVKAELDAFRAEYPSAARRDERHISVIHAHHRGAFES